MNKDIAIIAEYLGMHEDKNFKIKSGLIRLLETFGNEQILTY